jgi:large subunit ribosomal protein L4
MKQIINNVENMNTSIDKIFEDNPEKKKKAIGLIHRAYLTQLKNSRKYLASTKTKSEVRGGGKKPWKQKGTGNARAGSSRSPLWKGGGVSFGPKPRTVSKKINKKERRLAILSALYLKKQQFIFVDNNSFNEFTGVKTKNITNTIKNLG